MLPMHRLKLALTMVALLLLPALAQELPPELRQAAAGLSKTYVINYDDQRKLTLNLPEGYAARRVPNFPKDAILCPWNEFFIVASSTYPAKTDLNNELQQLVQAHQKEGMEVKNSQIVGSLATLELAGKVDGKLTSGHELLTLVGPNLWVISMTGYDSSLADQKAILKLMIDELTKK